MTREILEHIIHLIFVLPITLLTLKDRKSDTLKILFIFSFFFLLNTFLLSLPLEYEEMRIFSGKWNWTGKIFAISGSIMFLWIYRKFELKDYYLTFKQNKKFAKTTITTIIIILLLQSSLSYIYFSPQEWNTETILFQLTFPGIDEEIAYRGIMLGLLAKITRPIIKMSFVHPAILVTAILFGFAHGLNLNGSFELSFKSFPFFYTMMLGILWGWITMKSGSILFALISHNLGNVIGNLIRMR